MVDAILLLVDAAEGPLPQTRYVLPKAMARRPAGRRGAQQDRPLRRPPGRSARRDLRAVHRPRRRRARRSTSRSSTPTPRLGTATPRPRDRRAPTSGRCSTCWSRSRRHRPTSRTIRSSCWSPTCSANDYVGRMAVGRIWNGTIRMGQRIAVVREEADDTDGAVEPGRTVTLTGTVTRSTTAQGIERVDITEAGPGEIVAVAGLPEVTIGDTHHRSGRPAAAAAPGRRRADPAHDVRREHLAAGRARRQVRDVAARSRPASTARCWATCRSRSSPPSRRTRSRCAVAASCSWQC